MPTTILFCIAMAVSIWAASIIICKMIRKEYIHWFIFMAFAIGLTSVITHFMGIW